MRACTFPGCLKSLHSRKYCQGHHAQLARGGVLRPLRPAYAQLSLEHRLRSQTKSAGHCLLWTGVVSFGAGRIRHEGHYRAAHVVAWELARGPLRRRERVVQSCGNRLCIAVEHLRVREGAETRPLSPAQQRALLQYRGLAVRCAMRWVRRHPPLGEHRDDLVQSGLLAIAEAAATNRSEEGLPHFTFLEPRVKVAVARQVALILFPATVPAVWTRGAQQEHGNAALWRMAKAASEVGEGELGPIGLAALRHANLIGGAL